MAAVALLASLRAVAAPAVDFTPLGDLPGGLYESYALAVSADGSTVVGRSIGPSGPAAFRWTAADGMIGLGELPGGGSYSEAFDVSDDGAAVVGWSYSSSGTEAFVWRAGSGIAGLGSLQGGTNFHSEAYAISADGLQIFGRSIYNNGFLSFVKPEPGAMLPMPDLPGGGTDSVAMACSADGSVIVGRSLAGPGYEAARWSGFAMPVSLGDLPGGAVFAQANGVTADGSVIVGFGTTAAGREAFRWTAADGMVSLGYLPGGTVEAKAWGVSDDGGRVVGWSGARAFVWEAAHGMRDLNQVVLQGFGFDLQGWGLVAAYDISADGLVIVGLGFRPGGAMEGWRLELPPEGDLTEDGRADGADIAPFVAALLDGSTAPNHRRHADFVRDGMISIDDAPGMIDTLLGR